MAACGASAAALVVAGAAGAEPTWVASETIDAPRNESASTPGGLVALPDGTVIAGWEEAWPERAVVAERPPGGRFSAPQQLSDAVTSGSVRLAADERGTVVAVWQELPESCTCSDRLVRASIKSPGGSFGPPQTLAREKAPMDFDHLAVAVAGDVAVVTWTVNDDDATVADRLVAAVKPAGAMGFGGSEDVAVDPDRIERPSLAVAPSGAAVVAWSSTRARAVRAAARPPGGAFMRLADVFAAPGPTDHLTDPKVVMTASGRATVAWAYAPGGDEIGQWKWTIKAASRGLAGDFGPVEDVSDPESEIQTGSSFDLAADDEGTVSLVFGGGAVQSVDRLVGGTFSPPVVVDMGFASGTRIAMAPSGTAIVTWDRAGRVSGDTSIWSAMRPRGGTFGSYQRIRGGRSTYDSQLHVGSRALAVDGQGNAALLWATAEDVNPGSGFSWQHRLHVSGYDAAPPTITKASFPVSGMAGDDLVFVGRAVDVWSPVALSWAFGDGATAEGGEASHAYTYGGLRRPTLTATDAVGNAATTSGSVVVAGPPAPTPEPASPPVAEPDFDAAPSGSSDDAATTRQDVGVERPAALRPAPDAKIESPVTSTVTGAALPVVAAHASLSTTPLRSGRSRLRRLAVTGLRPGDRVRITCWGPGCSGRVRKTYTSRGARLDLDKTINKVVLAAGARLTVTVTRAGAVGRVFRATMVRRKKPRLGQLCLPPGARRPSTCRR